MGSDDTIWASVQIPKRWVRWGVWVLSALALLTVYPHVLAAESVWAEGQDNLAVRDGRVLPGKYRNLVLDVEQLKGRLKTAPHENDIALPHSEFIVEIPLPDGKNQRFRVVEAPVMSAALSRKYPDIRSFAGQGIDEPSASLRFDISPKGFHGAVISPAGNYYIDPVTGYDNGPAAAYISYTEKAFYQTNTEVFRESAPLPVQVPEDPKWNDVIQRKGSTTKLLDDPTVKKKPSSGTELRTYRLALAVTGEYAAFHGGTVEGALAAMNTTMVRVNGIFETEVAIRMVLVDNTDELIYLDPDTDPYSNDSGFDMLGENQATIDDVIGVDNYDIGHVFSTGGGGIAQLQAPCGTSKAQGVTGSSSPTGDPFDVEYVAHEMGHQYGANHTYNNYCGGNRASSAAYEPGSGTTIMSYAGICSPNVQNTADGYFHNKSYNEMYEFSVNGGGNSCAAVSETDNSPPVITMPEGGFVIPISTPFALTASASDADGHALTYNWEQFDLGPTTDDSDTNLTQPSGNQPIFRSWPATSNPTRIFPRMSDILTGQTTLGELLPTYSRDLTFKLTVRDNQSGGGGVSDAQISFTATDSAGPFELTNEPTGYVRNSMQAITWDVANTNQAPVNASQVDILISYDGGQTFPDVLASEVDNDGNHEVMMPDVLSSTARLKIQASANIFFTVSSADFALEGDSDGDGFSDSVDVFPDDETEWADHDEDGIGDNADLDDDDDGVADTLDNCPLVSNTDQLNTDNDSQGNVCDADDDNDGVGDSLDAFPLDASESVDFDGDGIGDNEDTDDDNDEVADTTDNCPRVFNPGQEDADGDGEGNVCDSDDPGIGHRWSDSDAEHGPTFDWVDISQTGTEVIGLADDNAVGPFDIGFDFMMYGDRHGQIYIHSNGVISFVDPGFDSVPAENMALPVNANRPAMALIVWFWDDLEAKEDSHVYYELQNNSELVIQFSNFGRYGDATGRFDAQVIIGADGQILFQYLEFRDGIETSSATVGIENANGSAAMQVAFDETYLHDELAVLFRMDSDLDGRDDAEDNCPFIVNSDQGDADADGIGNACDLYQWLDSNQTNGPEYEWIDVSQTGTEIQGLTDDGHVGPFEIGFGFDFFGTNQTQFFVQSNGAISFDDQTYSYYNHATPNAHGYNDLIAWMWDDLLPLPESRVFYQTIDGEKLVIQFVDYGQYSSSGSVSAEVILASDGKVTLQYMGFSGGMMTDSATIGMAASLDMDNAAKTADRVQDGQSEIWAIPAVGAMAAYNTSYLQDELAIQFQVAGDVNGNDTDGDGIDDSLDNCVSVSNNAQTNTDNDAFGDACDEDDDGDGVPDDTDAFPLDPGETLDTDNDGVGNNTDTDDDGDGVSDEQEAIDGTDPLDPASCATCFTFDVDDNHQIEPLADGLLVLRHLFDFQGASLIDSVVDPNGGRTSAQAITDYLQSHEAELDIDGNGEVAPLSDGLLLLRHQFGFQGQALIADAIGAGATRTSAEEIATYITEREHLPEEPSVGLDTDNDGLSNALDDDDDNDGVNDVDDAFPLDPTEWDDSDGDGIGDNSDPIDDNPSSSGWVSGQFASAAGFEALCASPRSGSFPDMQGTVTDENFWIRSYSNDTYLWYDEIDDVDPGSVDNVFDYFGLMKTFATTASGNAKDKFHFTYNTEEWESLSQSGVSAGYGIEFFRVSSSPPRSWLVALVQPESPASAADLARGADLIAVDGVDFTGGSDVDTLNAALFPETLGESHEFVFRDLNSAEERTVTLVSAEITLTPVQSVKVIETGSGPVGYMLFNDHIATAEAMLMDAVEIFAAAQVTDLVIDMRYNGGGYLAIANALASMVAGDFANGQTFSELEFNDKHPNFNPITGATLEPRLFYQTAPWAGTALPKLNLDRLFVLSGGGTCSASEAVINGLRGIGTEVILIGDTTCGKPYGFYAMDNCGVSYFTVQFRGVNALGFGDYTDGFSPANMNAAMAGTVIPGCYVEDDLSHALGDTAEARLSAALNYRQTGQCPSGLPGRPPKGLPHRLSRLKGSVVRTSALSGAIARF